MKPSFTFDAGRLRLELIWQADRFAHAIGVMTQGRLVPLLASVEGAPDIEWPPSPPVQGVEHGPHGEIGQIMCIGMAGRCHWSVGVEMDARAESAVFDVACRVKQAPPTGAGGALGSIYRTATAAAAIDANRTLRVEAESAGLQIESLQASPGTAIVEMHVTDEGIRISPSGRIDQTPCTIRWRYAVTVV